MSKSFKALALLCLAFNATASNELLPVEEAFRYAITDTGSAFEIDWAIYEHAYLYKEKLSFESGTESIVLGQPELPRGQDHEDEFFGKQEVYRDFFFVTIPYTVTGERPASANLILRYQGCDENVGLCYMPMTVIETVTLETVEADKPKLQLGDLGGTSQSEFPHVDEVFFPELFAVDGNTVELGLRIVPGFYIYKDKLTVRVLNDNAQAGRWDLPQGKMKSDEYFGEMEVYLDSFIAKLVIARATPEAMTLELELGYQGCAEGGLCYMPQTRVMTVELPEATAVGALEPTTPVEPGAPVSEQAFLADVLLNQSIWKAIGIFFVAGLALALTPCVLPMIPILSGIIAGEGDEVTPMRGFTLALSYVLGMAIVYTGAGVAAAAAGMQLQATFNQPWILILFSGLFVFLALGMFGAFELQMPSSIQTKLSNLSGRQKSGTTAGAFIMGGLSALIVTACVAPVLIAALMVIAQTGDLVRGGTGLFAMSLGMGAPLLVVGAAQGKYLPKAGPWMVAVRNAFGFMMLGLAIWMLSRMLPGNVTMLLWAVLVCMAGVFMGGLTSLTTDSTGPQKLGKGFGFLAIIYGVVLLLGGLAGGSNPLKPLASIGFGSNGAIVTEAGHELPFRRIKTVDDLDRELELASRQGKTAFLDFYADWCVSCKEMEAFTFTDAAVQATLANTVWLQADVTANDAEDQELLARYEVFGPPTIIFFGTDGQQRHGYEVVGYMKATDFVEHLRRTFDM
jgi:thiol:disulfide interchange protein DsbD